MTNDVIDQMRPRLCQTIRQNGQWTTAFFESVASARLRAFVLHRVKIPTHDEGLSMLVATVIDSVGVV